MSEYSDCKRDLEVLEYVGRVERVEVEGTGEEDMVERKRRDTYAATTT